MTNSKKFAALAVAAFALSYIFARLGASEPSNLSIWYAVMSYATGSAGGAIATGIVIAMFDP